MGDPNGYMANLESYRAAHLSGETGYGNKINPDGSTSCSTPEARQAAWDAARRRVEASGALKPGFGKDLRKPGGVLDILGNPDLPPEVCMDDSNSEEELGPSTDVGGVSAGNDGDGAGEGPSNEDNAEPHTEAEVEPAPTVSE